MPVPALLPAGVGVIITVSVIVASIGGKALAFAAGYGLSKVVDKITEATRASTSNSVLFKVDGEAYGLMYEMMRVVLVTRKSSWLRKVRVHSVWKSLYDTHPLEADIEAGDAAGWDYNDEQGSVRWDYRDIQFHEGSVVQLELYRDTWFTGWYACSTVTIDDDNCNEFRAKCLYVYWDDDDGTFFINNFIFFKYNAMMNDIQEKHKTKVEEIMNPSDAMGGFGIAQRHVSPGKPVTKPPLPVYTRVEKKAKATKKEMFGDGELEKKMHPSKFHKLKPANDKNGDGKPDKPVANDKNGDGKPDKPVANDKNGDGKPDKPVANDKNGDGKPDKPVANDKNGDGKPDKPVANDKNGDGKPDKPTPAKPKTAS
eukprot:gene9148-10733_t